MEHDEIVTYLSAIVRMQALILSATILPDDNDEAMVQLAQLGREITDLIEVIEGKHGRPIVLMPNGDAPH